MSAGDTIDAVITWVDGDDPQLAARRAAYLGGVVAHREASRPTRFRSVGEIDYCVASILRHAPFVRRIFIVTDAQEPPFLTRARRERPSWLDRVQRVDHRDIFAGYEQYLPTFSNRPIETLLHRIPGLAERFISFNDDFMLLRPVQARDFFIDGQPVLRGAWRRRRWERDLGRALLRRWPRLPISADLDRPTFWLAQANAARLAGYRLRYFHSDHVPRPLRRATLEQVFAAHPDWLHANLAHRLRHASQFFALALANHLELRARSAVVEPELGMLYVEPAEIPVDALQRTLDAAEQDARLRFACVQSLDEALPEVQQRVVEWLDRVIGRLPP